MKFGIHFNHWGSFYESQGVIKCLQQAKSVGAEVFEFFPTDAMFQKNQKEIDLFNPTFGPINTFLKAVGMEKYIKNWLSDPDIVLFSVILPGIWQYLGYHFVILLAGMQSIPSEIIESARIDGANTVDIFSKIVIPNVKSMIQVCIIINLSGAIKTFDIPYMMTQGGPGASSTFLAIYMYKEAFVDSSIGRGTAIAVCMLIMAVLATAVVNKIFAYINRND